jgi:hypothetical protein
MGILWLASCGAIINALGSDDDPATTAQPTPAATTATTAPPVDETTTEPEPEPEPTQETVKVGEKVRDGGYQFIVTKVACGVSGWALSIWAKRRKASSVRSKCG